MQEMMICLTMEHLVTFLHLFQKLHSCYFYFGTYGSGWDYGIVCKVIENDNLQQNAFNVGLHLKQHLNSLKDKISEDVGTHRKVGLLECIQDHSSSILHQGR